MTDNKTQIADEMMEELKAVLIDMVWGNRRHSYNNHQLALPWVHEDYIYQIKRMQLSPKKEAFYLDKIERIVGEYAEFL